MEQKILPELKNIHGIKAHKEQGKRILNAIGKGEEWE